MGRKNKNKSKELGIDESVEQLLDDVAESVEGSEKNALDAAAGVASESHSEVAPIPSKKLAKAKHDHANKDYNNHPKFHKFKGAK